MKQHFGWIPDLPDKRDFKYQQPLFSIPDLPQSIDLRPKFPPVYDQGALGSCTANALAGACEFNDKFDTDPGSYTPSRLFIYYNERAIEGSIASDNGAMLRDGIKTLIKQGYCSESQWPYNIHQFAKKPTELCYKAAIKERINSYHRIDNRSLIALKSCLNEGFPFVFGFTCYDSITDASESGLIPMPTDYDFVTGGHAVLAVGYDDLYETVIFRNSWGPDWGHKGYGFIPYEYITDTDLADDFWTIRFNQQIG